MARKKAVKQQFRHENGFGSIVKLSGNRRKPFAVRITTGWKDGKQIRKYLGYYPSEADALIALAEFHKTGVGIDLTQLTLEEVFNRWYDRVEPTLSASALADHNMSKVRLGTLGKKRIKEIKAAHLQDWLDAIDLKPGTKNRLKSTMHQVFEYSVENDIIQKNPVKYVKIKGEVEKTGAVFTNEEIQYLWHHANENEDYKTLLILIYSGMRINELLTTIKPENIDFDKQYAIGGNKTKAGKGRVIPFHNKTFPIIKERVEKYGCVVPNKKGKPTEYGSFHYRFKQLMTKLGWEHTIHDTRKTAISIMHSSNIPLEVIRVIVGHSGKGTTEKVYLYKNPEELVEFVNKIQI